MTNRVKSLEQDVAALDDAELKLFAKWFTDYQDRLWERQIAQVATTGKLDFLLDEVHVG